MIHATLTVVLRRLERRHSRRLHRAQPFARDRIDISTEAVYRFAARASTRTASTWFGHRKTCMQQRTAPDRLRPTLQNP